MFPNSRAGGMYYPKPEGNGKRTKVAVVALSFILILALFAIPSISRLISHPSPMQSVSTMDLSAKSWKIMVISDLDKKSKVDDSGKSFKSILLEGDLSRVEAGLDGAFKIEWGTERELHSGHNEAGRGMELSELVMFHGNLMTVDDRSGIVFEIIREGEWHVAPRYIIGEGDGSYDKGMKLEWATVKDGSLVLGSFGKEYTNRQGAVVNQNNNWVSTVAEDGCMTHEDWTERYNKMRSEVEAEFPGYVIHEAGAWSEAMKKWIFLPRRISSDPYDDMEDEKKGSDTVIIADESFRSIQIRHIGKIIPTHGFSSFKFVPGTQDEVIVALKSVESEEESSQDTFITVFHLDGTVLLEETQLPGHYKFEGIEFVS